MSRVWRGRAMKFAIVVAATVCAVALAIFAIPSNLIPSGFGGFETLSANTGLKHFTLADLNPLRFVFDYEQQQINTPYTPEQLGFHGSPVVLTPSPWASAPGFTLNIDKDNMNRAFAAQIQSQIQQSYQHSQDLQAYGRDPTHWIGPPPQ